MEHKTAYKITGVFFLFLIGFAVTSAHAAAEKPKYAEVKKLSVYKDFNLPQRWDVIAYQAKADDLEFTNWPARLCFSSGSNRPKCFEPVVKEDKEFFYNFQFVHELRKIRFLKSKGILFTAEFFAGGSGTLDLLTLWVYDKNSNSFENVLPEITITEQDEYKLFNNGELITATADWDIGKFIETGESETHYSRHKYEITIYRYDAKENRFEKKNGYLTSKKYKSLDEVNKIDVINPEMKRIQQHEKELRN